LGFYGYCYHPNAWTPPHLLANIPLPLVDPQPYLGLGPPKRC
jgi:hypothetical protein